MIDREAVNQQPIIFPMADEDLAQATHCALWDQAQGGTLLLTCPLERDPETGTLALGAVVGQQLQFEAGEFSVFPEILVRGRTLWISVLADAGNGFVREIEAEGFSRAKISANTWTSRPRPELPAQPDITNLPVEILQPGHVERIANRIKAALRRAVQI